MEEVEENIVSAIKRLEEAAFEATVNTAN